MLRATSAASGEGCESAEGVAAQFLSDLVSKTTAMHGTPAPSHPGMYDPKMMCTALLGGRTVMTERGPVCEISTSLQEQVRRESAPYTLSASLAAQTHAKVRVPGDLPTHREHC